MPPLAAVALVPPTGAHRSARRGCGRGFTIAEVLIASALLGFVVLGSLAALSRGLALANHARMVTLSSQVLQSAIEDLRLQNYSVISGYAAQSQPVNFTPRIASELLANNFTATSGMSLSASFTTLYASSSTQLGLTSVALTVSWSEGGVGFTRSARTYFSEKGLSDYIYVGF